MPPLILRQSKLAWGQRTYLMGVLNVTPDSFSDGGKFTTIDRALAQAHYLVESGADILDIGGQSTRPYAEEVFLDEELLRVIPVIRAIRQGNDQFPPLEIPISIDTTRSAVASAAIAAGADLVNDVSGATYDPEMLATVAELAVPIVLMHLRGTPRTMQQLTQYQDLLGEIRAFLEHRINAALKVGIPKHHLIIDPGIGFAKTTEQSLILLRSIAQFRTLGYPVLVGPSRKSFIGQVLNQPNPKERVSGTAAACCAAIAGQADILRLHDIRELRDTCRIADAIWRIATPH